MNTKTFFSLKYLLFTLCVLLLGYQLLTFTSFIGKQGMLMCITLVMLCTSGTFLFTQVKRYVSFILIIYILILAYASIMCI